jgi:ubiquinone/menaquinone biosynthesis C-methylase UbiE
MSDFQDRGYLTSEQYRDADNLNACIHLHHRFSTNPYGWFYWIFDQFHLPFDAYILEVGCGPGTLWLENRDRLPADWNITLSDLSPGMIQDAQANLASTRKNFTYKVLDAAEIAFLNSTFDAVVANHMLYHLPDRQKALGEITRVLRPDGYLYASTNGENHLRELTEIINQLPQSAEYYHSSSFSADEFTLENGSQQLTS